MDLVSAAVSMKHAEVMAGVQYAVARKLLDTQKSQGSAAVKLIEAAGQIMSKSSDELAVAATGLGNLIDTYG